MPQNQPDRPPLRVLIAGGGVAGLEAFLALRQLTQGRVAPVLMAPDSEFRYRPLSVTEPFGLAAARNIDLAEVALENESTFMCDALAEVDPDNRQVTTAAGRCLDYDALLIAIGTRGAEAVPGAVTFRDSADHGTVRDVIGEIERGVVRRVAFAAPGETSWPLGLYELALLSSAHVREHDLGDVELTLVTPEARPMEIFGPAASDVVGDLLDRAGIELRLSAKPSRFEDGRLEVDGGEAIDCDRVISLPRPVGPSIPGLPRDAAGFIPIDSHCGVLGLERVYAAGDATWFPVKQGGLAAQQADCAARQIAALSGATVESQVFRPVLRGALLTEWGPRYLRAQVGEDTDAAAKSVLWWPPAKVAGQYLAPFLFEKAGYGTPDRLLTDLDPPVGDDATDVESGHDDIVGVALSSADASARSRDFPGALRWLEVAEDLALFLPQEYDRKRISWQELERSD